MSRVLDEASGPACERLAQGVVAWRPNQSLQRIGHANDAFSEFSAFSRVSRPLSGLFGGFKAGGRKPLVALDRSEVFRTW